MLRRKVLTRLGMLWGLWWGIGWAAQAQTGAVRGTLLETGTGNPVSFASVVLLRSADSTFVAGTQASELGVFELAQVPLGQYVLRATAVGYRTGRRVISLTAGASAATLGTWKLRPAATQLTDVVVTAERAVVTGGLDKKVIDVSKDLTATGGTAIDALQNVPSVTVDQTGAVSIRGASNVTVFIDGKPTGTTLDQIPASSIQSVEVITNPSARYDASGAGGILNIVLKKERREGLNGQVSATGGTGDKANASLLLNYRKGKVNAFGQYDYRRDRRYFRGTVDQTTLGRDSTLRLHQDRSGASVQTTHALRLGLDYALTPEQTLTLAVQPRLNLTSTDETLLSRQVNATAGERPVRAGTSTRANASTGTFRAADLTLDYRREWAAHKGRELTASAVYTPLLNDNAVDSRLVYLDNSQRTQRQQTRNRTAQATAQVDYVRPLGEKSRFETGARSSLRRYDIDYQLASAPALAFDPSNRFVYGQYVQAAYGLYAGARGQLSYQAGLRAEHTTITGDQRTTGEQFTQRYLSLFPTAVLALDLPHDQRVQLSYSRRVGRPDAGDVNPFLDRTDQLNLTAGNPQLRPEFVNSFELGHQVDGAGGRSLGTTAFYRLETATLKPFRQVITDPLTGNLVTLTTRLNVGDETSYGLEVVGATPLAAFWKVNGTASAFRRIIRGSTSGTAVNTTSLAFTGRLNNTFPLSKRVDAQLAVNYRSPINSAQGTRGEAFNIDLAARYNVLGEHGTFTLRVADLFNTLRFDSNDSGAGFATVTRFKRESRIAYLGFTYRFGQTSESRARRKSADDEGGSDN
ncbi:outer membrane beta-barrel protein [Hymenobacter ruricola]|uniref:TonB-dependent receptor n=1 Tax=Hymenobacter ruricola TaxID=2791023 RepID=A0ABS0IA04_9BACT|nr:outer membrane beta-barrel protein [Hymenobacter ruricola]MBF9223786.1 TonB-dependent receptor [Hymenobacter ruricola]